MPSPHTEQQPPPVLLVDTNVVLDVILEREPWLADSAALLDAIARGRATGFVASHVVTTIHYITERANGRVAAATAIADLLELCYVVPVTAADFHRALALRFDDFEDAVQVAAALRVGAAYLVSRNERDFKGAPVPVRSPAEVLPLLDAPRLERP
jgi:predicted nucleic acid-binding protein